MTFVQKIYKNIGYSLVILGLFIWYLYHLDVFPIFADEAIYLNWSQQILSGQSNPFISVFDGKPPLFIWVTALTHYFISNLLLAGRLTSVVGLFVGMLIIKKFIGKISRSWANISTILVLITPFIFFHSRLNLLDTWLSIFLGIFTVSIAPIKKLHWGWLSGLWLGLAFWTKTTALFFIPLPYFALPFSKNKKNHLIQSIISSVISIIMILALRITPWFPSLFNRSKDFTYSFNYLLEGNFNHFWPNFIKLISWLKFYLTWPILILFILGAYVGYQKKSKVVINFTLATILLTLPMITLGKVISPRYYLPLGIFIPMVAGYYLSTIKKDLTILIVSAIFAVSLPINYLFQYNYFTAHLPRIDDQQYLQDWSSGIGIKHVSNYINSQSKEHSVKVLTEGYFGTLPDGLFVYQAGQPWNGMEIVGVGGPTSADFFREVNESSAELIYYVGNKDRTKPETLDYLRLIESYQKKPTGAPLQIFQVSKLP